MKFTTLSTLLLLWAGHVIGAVSSRQDPQRKASIEISRLQRQYNKYIEETVKTRYTGCTQNNILYRQEWGTLSHRARVEYTNAVQCLQRKPPISSRTDVPGSQSLYDDFVAVHILRANFIHFDGLFLHFHRYFLWLYEKALREECGYQGSQPYWDWTISWEDPRKSTVFDGSPYSMGSNGKAIPHGPTNLTAFGLNLQLAPATGGGCVYSGPFSNYTVSLGPVAYEPRGGDGGLAYNPRCLTRDISLIWSNNTKPTDVLTLLQSCEDIGCFDVAMEDLNGVHTGGHFAIGGLAADAFASAGDPAFWLHHAGVDRMWTIWQNQNPGNRTRQVWGTGTAFNVPPSADITLDTEIDVKFLAPGVTVGDVSSTIDGPFCYMYI